MSLRIGIAAHVLSTVALAAEGSKARPAGISDTRLAGMRTGATAPYPSIAWTSLVAKACRRPRSVTTETVPPSAPGAATASTNSPRPGGTNT
jgi:hypothetical protein